MSELVRLGPTYTLPPAPLDEFMRAVFLTQASTCVDVVTHRLLRARRAARVQPLRQLVDVGRADAADPQHLERAEVVLEVGPISLRSGATTTRGATARSPAPARSHASRAKAT